MSTVYNLNFHNFFFSSSTHFNFNPDEERQAWERKCGVRKWISFCIADSITPSSSYVKREEEKVMKSEDPRDWTWRLCESMMKLENHTTSNISLYFMIKNYLMSCISILQGKKKLFNITMTTRKQAWTWNNEEKRETLSWAKQRWSSVLMCDNDDTRHWRCVE